MKDILRRLEKKLRKTERPRVSVVVTSYNNGEFLRKCLEALLAQTLSEIEIICIDDASTDGSVGILREFAEKDARVKLILNRKNMGPSPSAARNKAMRRARAEYVMFCDGDDYYEPKMCEKMYQAIEESQADLAMSEIAVTYQAHAEMKKSDDEYYTLKYQGLVDVDGELMRKVDFAPTNKIFRRAILKKYRIKFPEKLYYEDAYFALAYLSVSKTIHFLKEKLYHYVRHKNSIMSQTWSKGETADTAIDHIYVITRWFRFLKKHKLLLKYNQTYWELFEVYLWLATTHSKSAERAKLARKKADEFVRKNKTWFDFANQETRDRIYRLKDAAE